MEPEGGSGNQPTCWPCITAVTFFIKTSFDRLKVPPLRTIAYTLLLSGGAAMSIRNVQSASLPFLFTFKTVAPSLLTRAARRALRRASDTAHVITVLLLLLLLSRPATTVVWCR